MRLRRRRVPPRPTPARLPSALGESASSERGAGRVALRQGGAPYAYGCEYARVLHRQGRTVVTCRKQQQRDLLGAVVISRKHAQGDLYRAVLTSSAEHQPNRLRAFVTSR